MVDGLLCGCLEQEHAFLLEGHLERSCMSVEEQFLYMTSLAPYLCLLVQPCFVIFNSVHADMLTTGPITSQLF